MSDKIVGILGKRGGQLGRMLASSASLLNIPIIILDSGPHTPAKQILSPPSPQLSHIDGAFTDPVKIAELARKVDVLTVEIEHVDVDALESVLEEARKEGRELEIHPSPQTIRVVQDKFRQKEHLASHNLPVSEFIAVESSVAGVESAIAKLGLPLMLKSRTLAYDGRGNFVVSSPSQISEALSYLSNRPLYAEKWVKFTKEIAVMVVRTKEGEVKSYPVVETVHKENICHLVFAPLRGVDAAGVEERGRKVAEDAVKKFWGAGVFGVEMFLMDDGSISINEIAPRPHNSGHYTIEACSTSQYSNHLRSILSLPLGSTTLLTPSVAMLNLIGSSPSISEINKTVKVALGVDGASVHLYGKTECRKGRKMGHITITAESDGQLSERLRPILLSLPNTSAEAEAEASLYAPLAPAPSAGLSHPKPLVSIIMGSDSDLPTMRPAASILDHFHIPFELTIVSAHRTPQRLVAFARGASGRGVRVVIAGAGGAAHLPGMVAAMTAVPVLGVPVRGGSLDGMDSLLSIVQMPRGIPVATVAINNSTNAALLAIRILSAGMPRLIGEMEKYMKEMEEEVMGKVGRLQEGGWVEYEVKK